MKILMIDKGMPFSFDSYLNEPLGGSENSFLLLSQGLEELGHSIVLLNSSEKDIPERRDNRIHHNVNTLKTILPECDVVILNRCLPMEPFETEKPIYYYAHDAYDQDHILYWMVNKEVLKQITKILCVSEWQRQTFNKYYDVPLNKMIVIGNSINADLFQGYVERNENKLVYASIPYKGLDILPQLFNDIQIKYKSKLELDVYSNMNLYGEGQDNTPYEKAYSDLTRMNDVILKQPVGVRELFNVFKSSNIMLNPQTYHESFGMNFLWAQGCGCIPITTNVGAAHEAINADATGVITKGKSILNHNTYIEYIDLIVELLNMKQQNMELMRQSAYLHARQWHYIYVSKKVLEIIK